MKMLLLISTFLLTDFAVADTASVAWPSRQSIVTCGGLADGEDLRLRVVIPNEVLAAETENGRLLIYLDLHKPGQVHIAMNDGITDEESVAREAALAKLPPDEAELLRRLSFTRHSEFYMGLTEGFAHLTISTRARSLSLSCKETPTPPRRPLE